MHGCRAIGLVRARRGAARALFDVLVGKHVRRGRIALGRANARPRKTIY